MDATPETTAVMRRIKKALDALQPGLAVWLLIRHVQRMCEVEAIADDDPVACLEPFGLDSRLLEMLEKKRGPNGWAGPRGGQERGYAAVDERQRDEVGGSADGLGAGGLHGGGGDPMMQQNTLTPGTGDEYDTTSPWACDDCEPIPLWPFVRVSPPGFLCCEGEDAMSTTLIERMRRRAADLDLNQFVRRDWADAADEIERLQAIVERLPKDAEGDAVYPGRKLVSTYAGTIQKPRIVEEIVEGMWRFSGSCMYVQGDPIRPCYGSTEAAEKARMR